MTAISSSADLDLSAQLKAIPPLAKGRRVRALLPILGAYALIATVCLVLLARDWQALDRQINSVALERGGALFRLIELTRDWNAMHDGVYVPVTEQTQPNPYLKHPRRDVVTQQGQKLTMVNPAYMTRQIAEIAEMSSGVTLRMSSLHPIRPGNRADAWEAETLEMFERGLAKERLSLVPGEQAVYRYMAPLLMKAACLRCHIQQGYRLGDISGGISVTMAAESLQALREEQRHSLIFVYVFIFLLVGGLSHLVILRSRRHVESLQLLAENQERQITERTAEMAAIFDSAAEAIMVTDSNNRIVQVNAAFTDITGLAADAAVGMEARFLLVAEKREVFTRMLEKLHAGGHWEGEVLLRKPHGARILCWMSATTIAETSSSTDSHYVALFSDITERKKAELLMQHRASHDPLTDLPNRALFSDRLHQAISAAARYQRSFALLYIDLDRFKPVNDVYGHAAGDDLLIEVAGRLVRCVRQTDTVARFGGDEFAVILAEATGLSEIEEIATRIVGALAESFLLDVGVVEISASVGVAVYPQHGTQAEALQLNADNALYEAKASGRNAWRVFNASIPKSIN